MRIVVAKDKKTPKKDKKVGKVGDGATTFQCIAGPAIPLIEPKPTGTLRKNPDHRPALTGYRSFGRNRAAPARVRSRVVSTSDPRKSYEENINEIAKNEVYTIG